MGSCMAEGSAGPSAPRGAPAFDRDFCRVKYKNSKGHFYREKTTLYIGIVYVHC